MRKKFSVAALAVSAALAVGLIVLAISCESSGGPVTVTGGGGPRAYSQPPPGQPETGPIPTETPLGYTGPRPTPTPLPSSIPPTPAP
jgi:hypothetical protein